MTETSTCRLGAPTESQPADPVWKECDCEASCEAHMHGEEGNILCFHDGKNDHSHCPVQREQPA
jgi:hypothetical protein